jgi:hypothetical protein
MYELICLLIGKKQDGDRKSKTEIPCSHESRRPMKGMITKIGDQDRLPALLCNCLLPIYSDLQSCGREMSIPLREANEPKIQVKALTGRIEASDL